MSTLDTINSRNHHELQTIQQALLDWFAMHRRDLPWRHTRDPYRVLVSEIMLQQTQVDRVLPKYTAFLDMFPTLEALAAAPVAEVIRMWSGLGYNRRAVNLQRTARAVLEQYGGEFPRDVAALQALPGIGPYTAGAVACFAFEQDVAFMDTNIRRAIRRIFVGPDDQVGAIPDSTLLELARAAVPPGEGWTWNQAIMELGATVCTANAPACWRCPLRTHCRTYATRQAADENIFAPAASYGVPSVAAPLAAPLAASLRGKQGADTEELPYGTAAPRRLAERRETPYAGSNRFFRGRIVAALRALEPGTTIALADLGLQIKDDYSENDSPWLRTLVEGLARDSLAQIDAQDQVSLPT